LCRSRQARRALPVAGDLQRPGRAELRGLGLVWALALVSDRQRKTPLPAAKMAEVRKALLAAGLLPFIMENRIHVLPPCVVGAEEVRHALDIYVAELGQLSV